MCIVANSQQFLVHLTDISRGGETDIENKGFLSLNTKLPHCWGETLKSKHPNIIVNTKPKKLNKD